MKKSLWKGDSGIGKKVKGFELVLAGIALSLSQFFLATLAPLAISAYGLYRWLARKRTREGVLFLVVGVLAYVFFRSGVGEALLKLPVAIGIVMILWGAGRMIFSKKKRDE